MGGVEEEGEVEGKLVLHLDLVSFQFNAGPLVMVLLMASNPFSLII